jgi:hypothetical protein
MSAGWLAEAFGEQLERAVEALADHDVAAFGGARMLQERAAVAAEPR